MEICAPVQKPWASVLSQFYTSPIAEIGTLGHLAMITLALLTLNLCSILNLLFLMSLGNFTLRPSLGYQGEEKLETRGNAEVHRQGALSARLRLSQAGPQVPPSMPAALVSLGSCPV